MKKNRIAIALLLCTNLLSAQTSNILERDSLKNVIVSGARSEESRIESAQEVQVLTRRDIQNTNASTTADLLQNTGLASVQKSQLGGGSPVLRGFEANRVLLVVDGVRLNNQIFRSGHLQNILGIDANMADRVEVLSGSGALMYGSDALGGVVQVLSQKPTFAPNDSTISAPFVVNGNAFLRYGTAANERTVHANINLGGKYFASRTSITGSTFGDLRKGANNQFGYAGFGDCTQYASGISAKTDTIIQNADPNVQFGSNYGQVDFMQRLRYQKSEAHEHNLNVQFSATSNVPRYDRLQTFKNGKPRFAEWYYGPQSRILASYNYTNRQKTRVWDGLNTTIAYQNLTESRNFRAFKDSFLTSQIENVQMISLNSDAFKQIKQHELRYGAEVLLQNSVSLASVLNTNIYTQVLQPTSFSANSAAKAADARYPNGVGSTFAAYALDAWEIPLNTSFAKKAILRGGLRFTHTILNTDFGNYRVSQDDNYTSFAQQNSSLDGSFGGVLLLRNDFRLAANVATGFHAPNIDDLGKTFEQTNGTIILPNPTLKPEKTLQKELTLERSGKNGFNYALTVFHTDLNDGIVVKPLQYKGLDSVSYNGARYLAVANVNVSKSVRYGAKISFSTPLFLPNLSANGSLTYTYGRDLTNDVPLDHIPPAYGILSLQYAPSRWSVQAFALFNAWKQIADYSPTGEDNLDKATIDGSFAWYTLNLRGGYRFSKNWKLQLGVENLLDANYRTFASGISGAGRNITGTLRFDF